MRTSEAPTFVSSLAFLNRDTILRSFDAPEAALFTISDNSQAVLTGTAIGQFGLLANQALVLDATPNSGPLAILSNDENGQNAAREIFWTGAAISTGISFMAWCRVLELRGR